MRSRLANGDGTRRIGRSLCPVAILALFVVPGADAQRGNAVDAYKAGRYGEALDAFREEAEARPGAADVAANVAATFARQGRHEEAVRELTRALELRPPPRVEAAIRYNLGTAQLELDRVDEAIGSLQASLRLDPSNREAKINLEIALRRRRDEPPGEGAGTGTPPPRPPSESSAPARPPSAAPELSREEAERLLDALMRRERLAMPRTRRTSPADPSVPDW